MELLLDAFEPEMLSQHRSLFASYFSADDKLLNEAYLFWLYEKNPHGRALMVRAVEDGRWIAFMAMIPIRLVRQGRQQAAYYVVNVLVHPAHQGRHLFGRMIGAAVAHCKANDYWLMGHPNALALPAWKRSRMQFRANLKLRLLMPRVSIGIGEKLSLQNMVDLQTGLSKVSNEQLARNSLPYWKPACEAEYLNWRFLQHPVNRYRINLMQKRDGHALLCVSRRMKPGVHLLIEAWSSCTSLQAAGACAPWLTLAAVTDSLQSQSKGAVLGFSMRKPMPFFCTAYAASVSDEDVSALGLAASDF